VRRGTARTRDQTLARRVVESDPTSGQRLIAQALPPPMGEIVGTDELEGMRQRLLATYRADRPALGPRDFVEAFSVFLMVVVATFPVVVPFLLMDDARKAMHVAQGITLVMLFLAGFAFGRHAGYEKPLRTGLAMAIFGAVLITAVKALGG
jgi:VIT1/CCC1 family predicted Fe2+/Mn2+ transporter